MIPKYRYDAVRSRERQLIAEMETLKQTLREQGATAAEATQTVDAMAQTAAADATTTNMIADLATKHAEAIFNGETEKAAAIQQQLLQETIKAQAPAQQPAVDRDELINEAMSRVEVQRIAEQLESSYPELDKDSDKFDADLNQEIIEVYEGLLLRGEPAPSALQRAADMLLGSRGLLMDAAHTRGLQARVAGAQAPAAMTATVGTTGGSDEGPNTEEMSIDEWEALPESARNKLLGM